MGSQNETDAKQNRACCWEKPKKTSDRISYRSTERNHAVQSSIACLPCGRTRPIENDCRVRPAGRRLSESANSLRLEESRSAVFLQHCEPNSPVTFPLSAGEGKGFIGLMDNIDADVSLTISSGEGAGIHLEKAKEADLFSVM